MVPLPCKDQQSANSVKKQMQILSANFGVQIKPVFQSKKIGQILAPKEKKPPIVNNQYVVYKFECDLCDTDYIEYTARHLHQRINEHKYSAIGRHLEQHGLSKTDLVDKQFSANVFKATPLVAFRRTNNLSDLLVSAKLRNPTQNNLPHGSFRCGDNCLTCNYITDGRTSYTFHSTGETRHITHHIDCNSKNVIYMVHCNRCHKQYIGETKRRLKDRFNEHRRPVDKQTNRSKPTTVSEHFLSNDHNASDMLLIPLELIKSNRDSVRKAREAYLIDRGQTIEPLGLNKRDET